MELILAIIFCAFFMVNGDIPEACLLPRVVGPCRALIPMYHFNVTANECQLFKYGGCRGNGNKFKSLELCERTCPQAPVGMRYHTLVPTTTKPPVTTLANLKAECKLPSNAGNRGNNGISVRYYYFPSDNDCRAFTYAGIGGNKNNFRTYNECLEYCQPQVGAPGQTSRTHNVTACEKCLIGNCSEANKTISNYDQISPFMQIFFNMKAKCDGYIDRVQFINHDITSPKFFFLAIWKVDGAPVRKQDGSLQVNSTNMNITLQDFELIRPRKIEGWQNSSLDRKIAIESGNFIGIHMLRWVTYVQNLTVPFNEDSETEPAIVIRADHLNNVLPFTRGRKGLPFKFDLLDPDVPHFFTYRTPALLVHMKTVSDMDMNLEPL